MAFSLWTIEERKFDMKKYLLLTGLFAVLTFNSAQAQSYYYENSGYYDDQPVQYIEVEPIKKESHYHRITNAEAKHYEEKQAYKNEGIYTQNSIHPYVGLDAGVSHIKFKNKDLKKFMKSNYKSGTMIAGVKLNNRFGFEGFYQQSMVETKSILSNYKVKSDFSAIGLDFITYTPISQETEILFALGMAQYNFHETEKIDTAIYEEWEKDSFNTTGFRLGLGLQYYMSEYVALRGMVRYIKFCDTDIIKDMTEISLGLRFIF